MNHIIFFSGGKSSFTVADWVKEKYPEDNIVLYFTDTMWEDADLYRFINEASDKLELPMLTHAMGVNPIQLMFKQKVLFNSRIGNCSKYLKMKVAADFIKKGKVPQVSYWYNKQYLKDENFTENATLYFGIGWDEAHREGPIRKNWEPFEVCMPLIDEVIDNEEVLRKHNIKRPRLYDFGFVHNNCRSRCVKAGQGHFTNLYKENPRLFIQLADQERHMSDYVGYYHAIKKSETIEERNRELLLRYLDSCYEGYFNGREYEPRCFSYDIERRKYAFMKKQRNGETFPYQLHDLLVDIQQRSCEVDTDDIGGCGCFVQYN